MIERPNLKAFRQGIEGLPIPQDVVTSYVEVGKNSSQQSMDFFKKRLNLDEIRGLKRQIEAQDGLRLSRPALTAVVSAYTVGETFQEAGSEALKLGVPGLVLFVLSFDMSQGFSRLLADVYLAEENLRGKSDDILKEAVISAAEETLSPIDAVIEDFIGFQAEVENATQKLIKDPTGYYLLDSKIEELEEILARGVSSPYLDGIPQFCLIGAKAARDFYKFVYPLTGNA